MAVLLSGPAVAGWRGVIALRLKRFPEKAGLFAVVALLLFAGPHPCPGQGCTAESDAATVEAIALYRSGESGAAIDALERALASDPACARAHSQMGLLGRTFPLSSSVDYHLGTAVRLAPDDPEVLSDVALATATGGEDGAVWFARRSEELGGRNAQTRMALGMTRMALGDQRGAMALFGEAFGLDPEDPFALMIGAIIKVASNRSRGSAAVDDAVASDSDSYIGRAIRGLLYLNAFQNRQVADEEFTLAESLLPSGDELAAFYLARIICEAGDPGRARAVLSRRESEFSPGLSASYWLGLSLLRSGRTSDAERELELAGLSTESADAYFVLGLAKESRGDMGGARTCYLNAVRADTSESNALDALAVLYYGRGEHDTAMRYATRAASLDSTLCMSPGIAGELLVQAGKAEEGLRLLERARRTGWLVPLMHQKLTEAYWSLGRHEESYEVRRTAAAVLKWDRWAQYNLGVSLSGIGDHAGAEQAYLAAIDLDPEFVMALDNLGITYLTLGREDDAERAFRHVVEIDPTYVAGMIRLAVLLEDRGQATEGLEVAERAHEASQSDTTVGVVLANMYIEAERPSDAADVMEQVVEEVPGDMGLLNVLGEVSLTAGRFERAREVLETVVASGGAAPDAYSNLGVAYEKLGRYEDSARTHEIAVEMAPLKPELHYNLGAAYTYLERDADAEREYLAELDINPEHVQALGNLGSRYLKRGEIAEAVELVERALELDPDYVEALSNLSLLRLEQGRNSEAVSLAERALAIAPGHLQVLAARGLAAVAVGDLERAREILTVLESVAPDLAEVLESAVGQ